jgi:hypothetical protein
MVRNLVTNLNASQVILALSSNFPGTTSNAIGKEAIKCLFLINYKGFIESPLGPQ